MSPFEIILIVFGSSGLTGLVSSFITFKYKKKKEEAQVDQEVSKAESINLKNIKEVIDLYKTGMKDLQDLMTKREKELSNRLEIYIKKVEEYQQENDRLSKLVDKLKATQLKLQTRLDTLTAQSLRDCNKCSYRDDCLKFKAKELLKNENEVDDKSV